MDRKLLKALSLARHLEKKGFRTVIVGGAVRDLWLGLKLRDVDLSTAASQETLAGLFPGGHPLGKPPRTAFLVPWQGLFFEMVSWTGENLEEDLARRDFTVNAMALTTEGDTVAPGSGKEDLAAGRLRFNGSPEKRLAEDPVRAVRMARFAATLPGFTVPAANIRAVRVMAPSLLENVANERIGAEILKSLPGDLPLFLEILQGMGLFGQVLPDVAALDGVGQDPAFHPEGDALVHTLRTVGKACRLSPDPAVRAAALFHDVGKAPCALGDGTFRNHDLVGSDMARGRMTLWAWPSPLVETVTALVRHHMIPILSPAPHALLRLARRHGTDLVDRLFTLALADIRASGGSNANWRANRTAFLKGRHRLKHFPVPLDGNQVMDLLDIPPGPAVGKALAALEEAAAEGKICDREEARRFLLEQ